MVGGGCSPPPPLEEISQCLSSLTIAIVVFLSLLQAAKEHYQLVKEDYQRQVEKLTKLVDNAVDPVMFLAASGEWSRL